MFTVCVQLYGYKTPKIKKLIFFLFTVCVQLYVYKNPVARIFNENTHNVRMEPRTSQSRQHLGVFVFQ